MSPLGPDESTIGTPYSWMSDQLTTTVTALAGNVDASAYRKCWFVRANRL